MKEEIQKVIQAFSQSSAGYLKVSAGGESLELNKKSSLDVQHPSKEAKTTKGMQGSVHQIISKYVGRYGAPKIPLRVGMLIDNTTIIGSIDSMGLEHDVLSPHRGTITEIFVQNGDVVEFGQLLFTLKEGK